MEPMKGIDTLLRAVSDERLAMSHWTLRIVGSGSEEASLKALAQELGISDRVTFVGRLVGRAVFDEYAQAEIFCGLSRSEALGNVFLEAQSAGCAVIAPNVGGIPDIVKDRETGMLVPPDDQELSTQVIQRLLSDAELRSQLMEAGTKNALTYDWARIRQYYADVYRHDESSSL
jgi:glycosyltransferase involved in cell wall biosynthesis